MFPQLRLSQSNAYSDAPPASTSKNIFDAVAAPLSIVAIGIKRRWLRERRRRKVGRAYDMAVEISRVLARGSEVLDVGCGNGYIAHHLSAMLGTNVVGIDVTNSTEAPIDYRQYDGAHFPLPDNSVDAVLSCYVLHHAQDVRSVLNEMKRVLRPAGLAVIYEDIPATVWDDFICWTHDVTWRKRTGACTFRSESEWQKAFAAAGFEVIHDRQLSRMRNLIHPVCRRFFVLQNQFSPLATSWKPLRLQLQSELTSCISAI